VDLTRRFSRALRMFLAASLLLQSMSPCFAQVVPSVPGTAPLPPALPLALPAPAQFPLLAGPRIFLNEALTDPVLGRFYAETERHELSLAAHPSLAPFMKRFAPFVEGLLTDKDGREPIRLTLVDDMRPGVSLVDLGPGERVLAVNLGLLRKVENDDELAYLIGQELERGHCDLNEDIARLYKRNEGFDRIRATLLENALESEADVRSLVGRVIEKGYNPHSAYELLTRSIEASEGMKENSDYSSRRDALALALSWWMRRLGRDPNDRFGDHPRQDGVLGPLREQLFDDPAFLRERRRQAVAGLMKPSLRARQAYDAVQDPNTLNIFNVVYEADFEKNWQEFDRNADGLFSDKARVDLQLLLHQKLDEGYEAERSRVLKAPFQARSFEHLKDFLRMELHKLVLSAPEPGRVLLDIQKKQKDIAEAEKALAESKDEYERMEASSDLLRLPKELRRLEHDYSLSRRVFANKDADSRWQALIQEPKETRNLWSFSHSPEELLKQGFRLRRVEGYASRITGRRKEAIEASMPAILDDNKSFGSFGEAIGIFLEVRPGAAALGPLLEAYVRFIGKALSGSPAERIAENIGIMWYRARDDGKSIWSFFKDFYAADPAAAVRIWLSLMKVLVEKAPGLDMLDTLIRSVWVEEDNAGPLLQDGPSRELVSARLESAFKRELSEAESAGQVLNALSYYQDALWNIGGRSKNILSEETSDAILEAALTRMESVRYPDGRRDQLRALLLARFPWLFHVGAEKDDPRRLAIVKGISGLVAMKDEFNGVLDYVYLVQLVYDKDDPESFYRLISSLQGLVTFSPESQKNGPAQQIALSFLSWLEREEPDDVSLAKALSIYESYVDEDFDEDSDPENLDDAENYDDADYEDEDSYSKNTGFSSFLTNRLRLLIARHASQGPAGAIRDGVYDFWRDWHDRRFEPFNCDALGGVIRRAVPEAPLAALEFLTAGVEGVSRLVSEITAEDSIWYHGSDTEWENRVDVKRLASLLKDPGVLEKASPEQLAQGFAALAVSREDAQAEIGDIFEKIFPLVREDAKAARLFEDEGLVEKLYYLSSTKELALWQLERKFKLSELGQAAGALGKDEVRAQLTGILSSLQSQLPEESVLRNELIDEVEKRLLTSRAESRLFDPLRADSENWSEHKGFEALSAPQLVARMVKSQPDRISLIRYLVGSESKPPTFESVGWMQRSYEKDIIAARKLFQEAETPLRVFLLQPLMDENRGIFSDPAASESLYSFVLGEGSDWSGVFRGKFMRAYLKALSPGERKVVLGAILSGFVGRPPGAPSLKSILEAMGPFGVKVGQFLRTSAVLSKAERSELDDFLDRALEPSRHEIYQALERVFGKNLEAVEGVGELLGSGSLNVVVLVRLRDPSTNGEWLLRSPSEPGLVDPLDGAIRRVVVRMQRPGAEGLVANENPVWERAIAELKTDPDARTRRMAMLIDEARSYAYENLKPGGVELDLSIEREAYPDAAAAYADEQDSSGLRVEVLAPLKDLQARLVPEKDSRSVSLYDYIPGTRLKALDPKDRARTAARILKTELRALFERASFDPDGHSGNWINDLLHGRLVRIDYAQLRKLPTEDRAAFRRAMAALVRPSPDAFMRSELLETLGRVFSFSGGTPTQQELSAALDAALSEGDLPEAYLPHERLMSIQDRMENALGVSHPGLAISVAPSARSALASLAKISIYEEELGKLRYGLILLDSLDISPAQYLWLSARNWAAGLSRTAASAARR